MMDDFFACHFRWGTIQLYRPWFKFQRPNLSPKHWRFQIQAPTAFVVESSYVGLNILGLGFLICWVPHPNLTAAYVDGKSK